MSHGVIEAGAAYTLAEFRERSGMGEWAVRKARHAGLRVRRVGNVWWVLGSDFLAWLARQDENGPSDTESVASNDSKGA
jgi:hypothetical protein